MKKTTLYLVLFLTVTTLFSSFKITPENLNTDPSEFEMLVQYLESNGNYINSELAPSIILAPEIKDNLKNDKYLTIDIRSSDWFDYGHIKNSVNVEGPELLNYFETEIDPTTFEKITIVCYSGQSASYYASLLRLYGFDNVYSLKWGMSSWAAEFASTIWDKNSKDQFTDQLETTSNSKPEKGATPAISTGNTAGEEILKARIREAFEKPYKDYIVKAELAFETPSEYFIVNYTPEEHYKAGHVIGAIQYQPGTSLSSETNLYTLPTDKKILVNCDTGLSSAYVVAYLQVLGYDVYNLAYGSNSYMNSILVKNNWNGWSAEEIKNYQVVE
jgi:rhodanese-related sulfurtransferase